MPSKTAALWAKYVCLDTNSKPLAGDLAQHTINWTADNTRAEATNNRGGVGKHVELGNGLYNVLITAAEANCDCGGLDGASTTPGAVIVPASYTFELLSSTGISTAITTGNWGTAGTWAGGVVPAAGDNIIIRTGVTVTVAADLDLGTFGTLELQGTGLVIGAAATVATVPTGWIVATNNGTITTNDGTVRDNANGGVVGLNRGTVTTNYGTVTNNSGTVTNNNGTVTANSSMVTKNNGTVTDNENGGTVENNNPDATVWTNFALGTVMHNRGETDNNYGWVINNSPNGIVTTNRLEVRYNYGIVATNRSGSTVSNNIGTVTTNDAGGTVFGGTVGTNNGKHFYYQSGDGFPKIDYLPGVAAGALGGVAIQAGAGSVQSDAAAALDAYNTTGVAKEASVTTIHGHVDDILADTNELELDWKNGGRLDLLLDAVVAGAGVGPGGVKTDVYFKTGGVGAEGVEAWVTSEEAGVNVVQGPKSTDVLGKVTFMLESNSGPFWIQWQDGSYNFLAPTKLTWNAGTGAYE